MGVSPESWGMRASVFSSPLPLPLQPFFCFRSNFRAITRLQTLATQATRETDNNAYAKFWSDQQRVLWYVMVFSGVVNLLTISDV